MPSTNYAYVNGRFVRESDAAIPIHDRSYMHGFGVFETLRVYRGRMFRARQHFARLLQGARAFAIPSSLTAEEIRAACRVLIEQNRVGDGVVRVQLGRDSLVITVASREFTPRPLRAVLSDIKLDPHLSGFKTTSRMPYVAAQQQADSAGVDEAVLLSPAGHLVECCRSNLFIVRQGRLLTPPLADGGLPGVTRATVIELALERLLPVEERRLTPAILAEADEVFVTNSLIEIAPVLTWSRRQSLTKKLLNAYHELVARELKLPGV